MSATRPMALWHCEVIAVGGDNAGRFLSAMLQRVQAQVGELRGLRMGVDRHHPTFFVKFVGNQHCRLTSALWRLPVASLILYPPRPAVVLGIGRRSARRFYSDQLQAHSRSSRRSQSTLDIDRLAVNRQFLIVPEPFLPMRSAARRILPLFVGFAHVPGRRRSPPGWHLPQTARTPRTARWS